MYNIVHFWLHISVLKLIHMNFCDRMSYLFSMVTKSLLYLSFFMWHMSLFMTPESNKWDYKKGCLGVTWWWLIQPCFGYCIPIASNGCFLPYKYIFSLNKFYSFQEVGEGYMLGSMFFNLYLWQMWKCVHDGETNL